MDYKRVLTIQDISCVGQCSLTVALPILSACGLETAILPSAVLSTHTAGFKDFTCLDLTGEIPKIKAHWEKEKIRFDAFYSGYLGSVAQIEMVKDIMNTMGKDLAVRIVDPAMADNGKLYPAFDMEYVAAMRSLAAFSDYLLPNLTEAALLTGIEYQEKYSFEYIEAILSSLEQMGVSHIVLTGISFAEGRTGVVVTNQGQYDYYEHELIEKGCHGTGDIYASAFTGALMAGKDLMDAASIAADYTVECIKKTQGDADHWYGAKFEPCLGSLIRKLS